MLHCRVGRPPDLVVVAVNFWDLAMYTKHGLGLQPHLNEPLLHAWRRDFGDLLGLAQVQLCSPVMSMQIEQLSLRLLLLVQLLHHAGRFTTLDKLLQVPQGHLCTAHAALNLYIGASTPQPTVALVTYIATAMQALAGNTTKVLYHTAPVPGTGSTATEEVRLKHLVCT